MAGLSFAEFFSSIHIVQQLFFSAATLHYLFYIGWLVADWRVVAGGGCARGVYFFLLGV